SIYARTNPHPPANLVAAAEKLSSELPGDRHYLTDEEFSQVYGADPDDLNKIESWAKKNKLVVLDTSIPKKLVHVEGTIHDINAAFGVDLKEYEHPTMGHFRGRVGKINVPEDLYGIIDGVFGLDTRPVGQSRRRLP